MRKQDINYNFPINFKLHCSKQKTLVRMVCRYGRSNLVDLSALLDVKIDVLESVLQGYDYLPKVAAEKLVETFSILFGD